MNAESIIDLAYIVAAVLFIFGIKMLGKTATARRGNLVSAAGMTLAVVATLFNAGIEFQWIAVGVAAGGIVGATVARLVKMTAMPEMVALFNGFGGIASLLVGAAEYHRTPALSSDAVVPVFLTVLIGGVTFSGSLVAYGKLAEKITGKPVLFAGQQIVNAAILLALVAAGISFCIDPEGARWVFIATILLAMVLGVLSVIPIGGADMPVVIALLNSYSGLAASAAGFVISNKVLIVSGSLVGASGIILTSLMCKAMNRSLANVLFSGFGSAATSSGGKKHVGEAKPVSAEDAYYILEAASSVTFVPGYGMAVAQAQHVVRELGELLEANGAEVRYCVHPVAGRMPGHMNVLLAEANVPYDQLCEPDDVNPTMETVDVAVVIGANDVVNPDARDDEGSPIYGMPIIEVDRARTCIVLKRSMAAGFAGVGNPLFISQNTRMLFGDAKDSIAQLVSEFKE